MLNLEIGKFYLAKSFAGEQVVLKILPELKARLLLVYTDAIISSTDVLSYKMMQYQKEYIIETSYHKSLFIYEREIDTNEIISIALGDKDGQ